MGAFDGYLKDKWTTQAEVKKLSLNTTFCFVYFMDVVYAKQFQRVEWEFVLG